MSYLVVFAFEFVATKCVIKYSGSICRSPLLFASARLVPFDPSRRLMLGPTASGDPGPLGYSGRCTDRSFCARYRRGLGGSSAMSPKLLNSPRVRCAVLAVVVLLLLIPSRIDGWVL